MTEFDSAEPDSQPRAGRKRAHPPVQSSLSKRHCPLGAGGGGGGVPGGDGGGGIPGGDGGGGVPGVPGGGGSGGGGGHEEKKHHDGREEKKHHDGHEDMKHPETFVAMRERMRRCTQDEIVQLVEKHFDEFGGSDTLLQGRDVSCVCVCDVLANQPYFVMF